MKNLKNLVKNSNSRNTIIYLIIFIFLVFIDQLTKTLLINKDLIIIPDFISFTYVENKGAAFGLFDTNIVLVVNIIIIIGLLLFWKISKKHNMKNIPFILVLAGSIGNLIDRIFRGYVIDFIHIKVFNMPTFNLADITIITGFILFIVLNYKYFFYKKTPIDN